MTDEQNWNPQMTTPFHQPATAALNTALYATGLLLLVLAQPTLALNIALTNDDGWDAPGVQALAEVLAARGHNVTLVGSATQQSGSSAGINGGPLIVTKHADRQYSAAASDTEGAEPLSSGMLAINIATQLDGQTPDLLFSGINSGANIGSAALLSGTVGAVIGAITPAVGPQIPAIAISTDQPKCDRACIDLHYQQVAQYAANLLGRLQAKRPPLLPPGIGLNVNYPNRPASEIQGVKVARQSPGMGLGGQRGTLEFPCPDCGALEIGGSTTTKGIRPGADQTKANKQDDLTAFQAGYITIVPIQADYTAPRYQRLRTRLANSWPLNP